MEHIESGLEFGTWRNEFLRSQDLFIRSLLTSSANGS
jgi:hypothetical protein